MKQIVIILLFSLSSVQVFSQIYEYKIVRSVFEEHFIFFSEQNEIQVFFIRFNRNNVKENYASILKPIGKDSVTDLISKYNFKPKINFKQIHRSSNDTLLMYLDGTKQTNEENMKIEGGYLTFYNIEMTAVSLPKIHTDSCLIIEINTYRDLLKTDYPPIYLNEFNVGNFPISHIEDKARVFKYFDIGYDDIVSKGFVKFNNKRAFKKNKEINKYWLKLISDYRKTSRKWS